MGIEMAIADHQSESRADSLSRDQAFHYYELYMSKADSLFTRATITAFLSICLKYLDVEVTESSLFGIKMNSSDANHIIGFLGWAVLYFFLTAVQHTIVAHRLVADHPELKNVFELQPQNAWLSALYLAPLAVLSMLMFLTIVLSVFASLPEMMEIVATAMERVLNFDEVVGSWTASVEP
jgi:hypothetical protein